MECQICSEKLFGRDMSVFTTICGHVNHEKCLREWMQTTPGKANCPQCRKTINNQTIHAIFLDSEVMITDQLLATQIGSLADVMKNRDKKNEESFDKMAESLQKITTSMNSFEYQNQLLKKENEDLKALVEGMKHGPQQEKSQSTKEDQKIKDQLIANLQKENGDLRIQRSEATVEMNSIREQINQLKSAAKGENKRPLREGNEPRPQNLTLKFDNVNDKLIIE